MNFFLAAVKWEMVAAFEVKISGSGKKNAKGNTNDISSIQHVTRKFHVVGVQTNGKEMYKKSVLHVQSCFSLIKLL